MPIFVTCKGVDADLDGKKGVITGPGEGSCEWELTFWDHSKIDVHEDNIIPYREFSTNRNIRSNSNVS